MSDPQHDSFENTASSQSSSRNSSASSYQPLQPQQEVKRVDQSDDGPGAGTPFSQTPPSSPKSASSLSSSHNEKERNTFPSEEISATRPVSAHIPQPPPHNIVRPSTRGARPATCKARIAVVRDPPSPSLLSCTRDHLKKGVSPRVDRIELISFAERFAPYSFSSAKAPTLTQRQLITQKELVAGSDYFQKEIYETAKRRKAEDQLRQLAAAETFRKEKKRNEEQQQVLTPNKRLYRPKKKDQEAQKENHGSQQKSKRKKTYVPSPRLCPSKEQLLHKASSPKNTSTEQRNVPKIPNSEFVRRFYTNAVTMKLKKREANEKRILGHLDYSPRINKLPFSYPDERNACQKIDDCIERLAVNELASRAARREKLVERYLERSDALKQKSPRKPPSAIREAFETMHEQQMNKLKSVMEKLVQKEDEEFEKRNLHYKVKVTDEMWTARLKRFEKESSK